MNLTIKTNRLNLRPFEEKDAPSLNEISSQEHILRWMPDWESTIEDTEKRISYFISQYLLATETTARVMFAVEFNEEIIGMVGIGNKKVVDNEIEIAYFISEAFAGQGYISEAAKAVSRWALDGLGVDYLIAIVETDNFSSQRVAEKCGFKKIDTRMILNSGESEQKPFYYYRLYNTGIHLK